MSDVTIGRDLGKEYGSASNEAADDSEAREDADPAVDAASSEAPDGDAPEPEPDPEPGPEPEPEPGPKTAADRAEEVKRGEKSLVEEAARAILEYEAHDRGQYRGRTALDVVEEALPEDADLGDVLRVARDAVRRARELRGDPPRPEGRAEGSRTESTLPLYGADGGREDLRPL